MRLSIVVLAVSAVTLCFGQSEQDHVALMKTVGATSGSLRKNLAAKSAADAAKDAKTLEQTFGKVHDYWMDKKVDDAMKFAMAAQAGFKDAAAKAAAGNFDEANAAVKEASTNCMGCHAAHREKVGDGWKIK